MDDAVDLRRLALAPGADRLALVSQRTTIPSDEAGGPGCGDGSRYAGVDRKVGGGGSYDSPGRRGGGLAGDRITHRTRKRPRLCAWAVCPVSLAWRFSYRVQLTAVL